MNRVLRILDAFARWNALRRERRRQKRAFHQASCTQMADERLVAQARLYRQHSRW